MAAIYVNMYYNLLRSLKLLVPPGTPLLRLSFAHSFLITDPERSPQFHCSNSRLEFPVRRDNRMPNP